MIKTEKKHERDKKRREGVSHNPSTGRHIKTFRMIPYEGVIKSSDSHIQKSVKRVFYMDAVPYMEPTDVDRVVEDLHKILVDYSESIYKSYLEEKTPTSLRYLISLKETNYELEAEIAGRVDDLEYSYDDQIRILCSFVSPSLLDELITAYSIPK